MTDFRALCAELLLALEGEGYTHWTHSPDEDDLVLRARAALAEPKPPCRYIYNPSQIAECGGPCEQGPKHCDCGELWIAEPEPAVPEGREPGSVAKQPTVMQLIELSDEIEAAGLGQIDFARAVLVRWGNSAPQPVPVSERLPRSEDCDAEGKCWWGRSESNDWSADWTLATHEAVAEFCEFSSQTVWLPAHALPLPDTND